MVEAGEAHSPSPEGEGHDEDPLATTDRSVKGLVAPGRFCDEWFRCFRSP
jgi:hypothetical protein